MKLSEALDELNACSSGHIILTYEARRLLRAVANRLLAQRIMLIWLLVATIGYGITLTWIASELIHENTALTYDVNVSHTAFKIQSENIRRLQYRVDELKTANTCLLEVLDKKSCNKAIKNTPLPKMVKETKS